MIPNREWEMPMTIEMDELDIVLMTVTGEPIWQPLGEDDASGRDGEPRFGAADTGWAEIAREIEGDMIWAEVVALLERERWSSQVG
jgi:hypothetical protein